jgi:hypothetical protein
MSVHAPMEKTPDGLLSAPSVALVFGYESDEPEYGHSP